jgi:probable F420-dependent oxidoreductase
VKFDVFLPGALGRAGELARKAEVAGFGALWVGEMDHDPMLPLAVAAEATTHIGLGSAVVLAFARSPMVVAQQAWALADASDGRFTLGLGTQVRPHITRRYSMPWSAPAPRMREYVGAVRHIWSAFQHGTALNFRGEHYRHDLMHALFNPGPIAHLDIPIALTGVGPRMTRLAGELADGFMCHAFTNAAYLEQVTLPTLDAGLRASGRSRADLWTFGYAFLAVGDTEEAQRARTEEMRGQIAFYAATPMYRAVLEAVGYGELQPELERLVKAGRAAELSTLVDDRLLDHFVVRGTLEELPERVEARYGRYLDRMVSYSPLVEPDLDRIRQFTAAFAARGRHDPADRPERAGQTG